MTRRTTSPVAVTALALAGLVGSLGTAAVLGHGEQAPGRILAAPRNAPVDPVPDLTAPGALAPAASCEELVDHYVENLVEEVTPWGWGGGGPWYAASGVVRDGFVELQSSRVSLSSPASAPFAPGEVGSSETGTNVQEQGVDEPDVVKTDGSLLVRLDGAELTTYDVSGDRVRELGTLDLDAPRESGHELLLGDDVALVTSVRYRPQGGMRTVLRHIDLSAPEAPLVDDTWSYDGRLLSSRLTGDTVRLVVGSGPPDLDFVHPRRGLDRGEALRRNRRLVRQTTVEDWLPSMHRDDTTSPLLACPDVHLPEDFSGAGSVAVVGFDLTDPAEQTTVGVAAPASTVYTAGDRLYLATSAGWGWGWGWGWGARTICCWGPPSGERTDGYTDLHAFALDGPATAYAGSGEVAGTVADRWSMDSADGVLRVAIGPSQETGNFNSVVTFAEEEGRLVEKGRVDKLGVNETIQSVRWFDDLAIVVTFRQVDPLYTIDLSDPLRPRLLGKLKIPGFSSYLHPIGEDRLLGLGTDASLDGRTRGAQAAVFDIRNLRDPKRISVQGYGRNQRMGVAQDTRQFTWLPDRDTALAVVSGWGRSGGETGWVSVLTVGEDGQLSNRMIEAAHGWTAVSTMRTVPLPDGRVVLSTKREARFLDL